MKIYKEDIQSFIPQRAPFIMIDNIVDATMDTFFTNFKILPENIFVENGLLREFALIENIAQSCSAGIALTKIDNKEKNIDGYLGSLTKLILYDLPKVNDTINTTIRLLAQLNNMYLFKGESFVNGKMLLECELKLVGK
jgi:3-hydroxymyristoyl/3-hydroxydecanoyl-(acyl carrier protein) dehydratase